jgi:predicted lipid-binding transport protein (Tim44 family)
MFILRRMLPLVALFALATVLVFVSAEANARAGGGGGLGNRGSRTFSTPPATQTAPKPASPIERSMTQPARPSVVPASPTGGFFNRPGLLGGLAAGFIGAGLFGLLFGHGLFGNIGGFGSIIGLLLQIGLIVLVARLIWVWWQRRQGPAYAGSSFLRGAMPDFANQARPAGLGAAFSGSAVSIEKSDYDDFERLLGEIQTAYGGENLEALRARATPEMLSYFADDLAKNASRGVVNRVHDVKLEQGDLAEAWREGNMDYATVAMRFSLVDVVVDRASGRVVEGDADHRTEATELWTFTRARGGSWVLSAIQQT